MKEGDKANNIQTGNGDELIVLKNITKKFGTNTVLDNISLAVEKGKTTVLSALAVVVRRF